MSIARGQTPLLEPIRKCIFSHQAIFQKGVLHCDISPNNLMENGMIVDFGSSQEVGPDGLSEFCGAGTRPFKAVNVLLGKENSVMGDLESFFWVLFWICIYREGSTIENRIVVRFDRWWYMDHKEVARDKQEIVQNEQEFLRIAHENFTTDHQHLVPWLNRLREVVFPGGTPWNNHEVRLYQDMMGILEEAQKDPNIAS